MKTISEQKYPIALSPEKSLEVSTIAQRFMSESYRRQILRIILENKNKRQHLYPESK